MLRSTPVNFLPILVWTQKHILLWIVLAICARINAQSPPQHRFTVNLFHNRPIVRLPIFGQALCKHTMLRTKRLPLPTSDDGVGFILIFVFFFLLSRSHPAIYSRHSQSRYLIRNKNHKLLISRHDMRLAEIWEYKMSCILSISRKSLGGARRQRCVAKANKCFCLPNAKWQIGFGSSSLVN